ncbi:hypothetical protein SDC9_186286 [bioreactor metagenome]|uniref:Uncharacterized protein n=1 Tax=bioreactor metagenome TaxID=1076179 RepID=A0A645HIC7_9ZZZZ
MLFNHLTIGKPIAVFGVFGVVFGNSIPDRRQLLFSNGNTLVVRRILNRATKSFGTAAGCSRCPAFIILRIKGVHAHTICPIAIQQPLDLLPGNACLFAFRINKTATYLFIIAIRRVLNKGTDDIPTFFAASTCLSVGFEKKADGYSVLLRALFFAMASSSRERGIS